MDIYDLLGQHVSTLINNFQSPGHYEIAWPAFDQLGHPLPCGIFICNIQVGEERDSIKLVLLE
jgi:hypothetical protein